MGQMYLMKKRGRILHTYSQAKRDRMVSEGWKYIAFISGWNVGITYKEDK